MTPDELIAALEAAPTGTRELGVAVLEAVGATHSEHPFWSYWHIDGIDVCDAGDESRVVTDLNFRLPGVPEGAWFCVMGPNESGRWCAELFARTSTAEAVISPIGIAHTERLARCIAELKAILALRGDV